MTWRLLSGLSDRDLNQVLAAARTRSFRPGDAIFTEGDAGTELHLLETGRVAIRVTTPDGDVATLTVLGPGEMFGEMALLHAKSRRTATALVLEPVTTLSLEREVFSRLCSEHPQVVGLLVGILASRVDRLSRHLVEALYVGVDKRVLRRLVELVRIYRTPGAASVVVSLTQEHLAGLAGTTRPTVNTLLRQLQQAGTVALSRGKIEILDVNALIRASL